MGRKLIGHIGVDSGQIMVGDPCYLKEWKDNDLAGSDWYERSKKMTKDDKFDYSYEGASMASCCKDGAGVLGTYEAAVSMRTKYGDGGYPVYLETDEDGGFRLVVEMGDVSMKEREDDEDGEEEW